MGDQSRTNNTMEYAAPRSSQSRPLSWHPNSFNDINLDIADHQQQQQQQIVFDQSFSQFTTATVNGVVTPMAYPMIDEPQIQELITPLEELTAQEAEFNYGNPLDTNQYWIPQSRKSSSYPFNPGPQSQALQPYWQWNNQTIVPNVHTAPSSPDFLSLQNDFNRTDSRRDEPKDELVGMGLYDSPAQVQSSSFLFDRGAHPTNVRKSLKLEDSFEPAPESEDGDADGEDEDEEDALHVLEDSPESNPSYARVYQITPHDLSGHSFFFEQDVDHDHMLRIPNMTFMNNNAYRSGFSGYGWISS